METFFASPERVDDGQLLRQIELASNNPIIDGVMSSIQGLLAVLNENRQIVSINKTLMAALGIARPEEVFGKRPGEAVGCIHSKEMPGGCGTSRYCRSCGAVISIVSCMELDSPVDEKCIITCQSDSGSTERMFTVRANPIRISEQRFLMFFLREITDDERRIILEKAFFHDINNVMFSLSMTAGLLKDEGELSESIRLLVNQLTTEIDIQNILSQRHNKDDFHLEPERMNISDLIDDLHKIMELNAAMREITLTVNNPLGAMEISSTPIIIKRIIINMLINAFEASDKGDEVKLSADLKNDNITFKVWNKQMIPSDISLRIFQHQISRKKGEGRGIGTYSMKLLGEDILNGKVGFSTSRQGGTEFYFSLPISAVQGAS